MVTCYKRTEESFIRMYGSAGSECKPETKRCVTANQNLWWFKSGTSLSSLVDGFIAAADALQKVWRHPDQKLDLIGYLDWVKRKPDSF